MYIRTFEIVSAEFQRAQVEAAEASRALARLHNRATMQEIHITREVWQSSLRVRDQLANELSTFRRAS